MSYADRPFRIIVVGAGVGGLVASSALQKAGIDHVVLEKHDEVAPPYGAGISMWPHGLRILHQLGYTDELKKAAVPTTRFLLRGKDGRVMHDNTLYTHVNENHGIGFYPFERRDFMSILYEGLPDKSYIRTGSAVVDVQQFSDRVEVMLKNGSVEVGDMVLGCDGVHSPVRSSMWDHAAKTSPGLINAAEKTSLKTHWKTLAFVTPGVPELGEDVLTVTHHDGIAFLIATQPKAVYFFVIFKLEKPFNWPRRKRYTEGDVQELADLVLDKPVTDQVIFSEVWKLRTRATVFGLEEGVLEHWHHGRIVLAGDAVHKVHPNLALGGNSAMVGVVSLLNNVVGVVNETKGPRPSGTALNRAFAAYQQEHKQRMKEIMNLSNLAAKMHTYYSPWHKLLASWLVPALDDRHFANLMGGYIAGAPKFDFLPCEGFPSGRLAWNDEKETDEDEVIRSKMTSDVAAISIAA